MCGISPRIRGLFIALCAFALVSACADQAIPRPHVQAKPRCPLSGSLVPSCGTLLGVTSPVPTYDALAQVERDLGRKVDFVYRFHDLNDTIPTPDERRLSSSGTILHLSIDPRSYSNPGLVVRWSDIAAGQYDDSLTQQAKGIASLHTPVFVTFDHEADQPSKDALGSAADFKHAWRHVHDLFTRAGATNVVWVWVVMGYQPTFERAGQLWPGNRYVDWISWEAYNQSGCLSDTVDPTRYRSFAAAVLPFYHWIHQHGAGVGMDSSKPVMISEAGTMRYPDDNARSAGWYTQIPAVLRAYPQIKAVGLWDHTGSAPLCDFRFDQDSETLASVAALARVPWLNPLAPVG